MKKAETSTPDKPQRYFEQSRPEMLRFIPENVKRTLELGCSSGLFSAALHDLRGCECWGVELDSHAAAAARERMDKVIEGDVTDAVQTLPDAHFDCIICNDILEHLVDPYTLLRNLKSKLAPGGVVVASIPNVRFCKNLFQLVIRGNWDYQDYGILDRTHLRFFTYKSLVRMWPSLGYELLRIEGLEPKRNIKTMLFTVFNLLLLNTFKDTRYVQFACVAGPARQVDDR